MPYSSLRKCTYPGCNTLVKAGRCPAHSTKKQVVRDPDTKRMYNSQRWKVMRTAQLMEYPWCAECLKREDHVFALEVVNIMPDRSDPQLFFDEKNLQSLCKPDHSKKTANEVWHSND